MGWKMKNTLRKYCKQDNKEEGLEGNQMNLGRGYSKILSRRE
jgi:hypothetical protein